jgi:hypothetical protein
VEKIGALLGGADLLLDARHPTELKSSPLSHDDLRRSQPGLAITAISWFGEHGPYRDYAVTDSVCRSLAGLVKLVGPTEGPPVLPRDGQIGVVAGLTAFIPTLALRCSPMFGGGRATQKQVPHAFPLETTQQRTVGSASPWSRRRSGSGSAP